MDRTIVLHLKPTPEQARVLMQTMNESTDCFNAVACLGFTRKCSNGIELHKQTYYALRAHYPNLPRTTGLRFPCQGNGSREIGS